MWIFIILLVFSIFSMNFSLSNFRANHPSVLGPQRYGLFFNLQIFFATFLKKFFVSKLLKNYPLRLSHLRAAKVDIISYSANFFCKKINIFILPIIYLLYNKKNVLYLRPKWKQEVTYHISVSVSASDDAVNVWHILMFQCRNRAGAAQARFWRFQYH